MPKARWSDPYQIVGLALLLVAAIAITSGYTVWGGLTLLAGGGSIGIAKRRTPIASSTATIEADLTPHGGPSRRVWVASGVMLVLMLLSSLALYLDARHGYQWGWPVFVFAGVGIVAAMVWAVLVMQLVQ